MFFIRPKYIHRQKLSHILFIVLMCFASGCNLFVHKEKRKTSDRSLLLCCKLFISESRSRAALDAIERAGRLDPETVIVNKFEDRAYNRVRYTLVSYVVLDVTGSAIYSPLQQTVLAMAEAAFGAINLETHSGAHPRLGVVDDILFHPLAQASLDEAAWLAKAVAADIGNRFQGGSKPSKAFSFLVKLRKANVYCTQVSIGSLTFFMSCSASVPVCCSTPDRQGPRHHQT